MAERTDEELKQLAQDLWAGKVFSDRHINPNDPNALELVFMPIGLSEPEQLHAIAEKISRNGMLYEYLDKAGSRGVNGYPCFFSVQILTNEEGDRFWPIYERLRELMEAL